MTSNELKEFLEIKTIEFNKPFFLESDPLGVVHQFSRKEDIEIIGFLVATIAWGNRKSIITSAKRLVEIMGEAPYEYILNYSQVKAKELQFVHRTFNANDLDFFFRALHDIYHKEGSLENAFKQHPTIFGTKGRIIQFRNRFLEVPHENRSEKHISNPAKGSSAKRLQMYLRWMVRSNSTGVDFGIWESISASELSVPLDVHTANISRKLGLITRKQNDDKALEELMEKLREFDPIDPAKYDFALFGLGAIEKF